MNKRYLTWIELDSKALRKNIATIRRLSGKRKIAVAVKANAYGHGLKEIISLLEAEDVEYIAVHSLDEAAASRAFGWKRHILVVGYIALSDLEAVVDLNLEPTVYNAETINRLGRLAKRVEKTIDIHLKVETGTNRQGVEESRLPGIIEIIKKHPGLNLKGVSTHFANIEDTTNHEYANNQLKQFNRLVSAIRAHGLKPVYRHTACSAALLLFDDTKFELVRPGIAFYGLWPSKETYLSYRLQGGSNNILSPILTWKTRIIQIKEVPSDAFIGYGCTYRTTSKTRLAILPIGYYEGYDRSLSNLAYVLIKGKRAPVRGRICMNLAMVDITDIKGVRLEDEVVLLGSDQKEKVTADQIADWAKTVNYEIISRINGNIPRLII
ncbi:MAG: alanine racemase [candidate division Zixibacteria bacterium HGW-Zixibacteria-1]|nr:MAG: alanine racemase [candidate division Zixibacteria bacterium HGW-Zixibacteria-1]